MKTLAVLVTLVGLATSAPAPQNDFQQNGLPQPGFQGLEASADFHPLDFNTEINGPVISARSHLGFNNPVIVKKKTGSVSVYRDSAEARADADPRESCGKQVRVKLCDDITARSADLRRSTKNEKLVAPKDDVEDSIKLAKEAVESVQRDLKTIEHASGKSAQWKHGETDKDLHEDIEAARQALEHAQKNFGNLESMSLRAATVRDNNGLLDIGKAKTEEERMAQWKLAIENIQRNVEIARNIEDSFKAAEDHSSFLTDSIDTTKFMRSDHQENKAEKTIKNIDSSASSSRMSLTENTNKKMQESEHHMISEKKAEQFGEDMKSAASESVQLKHEHHGEQHQKTKATQAKLAEVSVNLNTPLTHNNKNKGVGLKVDASLRNAHNENKMSTQDKSMATNMMHTDSAHKVSLNNEMSSRTSENIHHQFAKHKSESSNMKKTFESHSFQGSQHKAIHHGKSVANEWESKMADKNLKHEKSTWTETEQKDNNMMLKSAEANNAQNHEVKMQHATSGLTMKAAEHSTEHKTNSHDAEQFVKKSGLALHSDMKLADNVELASDIHLKAPLNVEFNSGVNLNTEKKEGKTVEQTKELDMEQARVVGYHNSGHHGHGYSQHGNHGHQSHYGHGHGHNEHGHGHYGHGHGHHGHGYHGKAAEFDSAMHPSMQVEMKDFSEKSAMENMNMQWKHHHDGRSAYGLGGYGGNGLSAGAYGGSAGAVGVFPHAKVGGCGIPLLLSCSPSVVSGSLAKSHGYAAPAPAYRNEEESKLNKNKREIMKTKETTMKKVKDAAKTINTDLEKKL